MRRDRRRPGLVPRRTLAAIVAAAAALVLASSAGLSAESPAPSGAASSPATSLAPSAAPPSPFPASGRTLRVPSQLADLPAAIAASQPGDVILLAPGTYPGGDVVPANKPGITIRGEDRNRVVFDGGDARTNAIEVAADGVTLENLTAHNYTANGFYWEDVEGYAGRYLTVYNVGLYGIYAIESRGGIFEESFVSGAADAAFYIGECYPCDATIRNVTATLSAVGYSGTNAGGNLVVEDSRFLLNSVGILPNSYDVRLEPPPQRDAIFRRNEVVGSGTIVTPRTTPLGGFHGIGIGVAGGLRNVVEANEVRGSTRYGIAVFTAIDRTQAWVPSGNHVVRNTVSQSGIADLALADGDGGDNCFEGNEVATSLPAELEGRCTNLGDGASDVRSELVRSPFSLLEGLPEPPPYHEMAAPPDQPTMAVVIPSDTPPPAASPDGSAGPSGPPAPTPAPVAASGDAVVLASSILVVALFAIVIVVVAFRSRVSPSRD